MHYCDVSKSGFLDFSSVNLTYEHGSNPLMYLSHEPKTGEVVFF